MKLRLLFLLSILPLFLFSQENNQTNKNWPSYRGLNASGVFDGANLPDSWDVDKQINIKWTADIPGLGISSPVIWGDKLFITTAISANDNTGLKPGIYGDISPVDDASVHTWKVYCYDKKSGELIWEKTSYTGVPKIKRHPKSTHANCSVATNGKQIVAFFGSEGLYCYTMEGELLWKKDFGVLRSVFFRAESAEWEYSSSPIIHKGVVIIQNDVMENSFVAAFNAETGEKLWKKERDEYPGWCTPSIYQNEGRDIIALNGYKHRGGYDFETGEEVWRMSGGGDIQIPTPIIGEDLIYFNSAHGSSSPILAIKNSAKGDITLKKNERTNDYVEWSIPKGGAYMQTMILYEGLLYNCKWNGNIYCYDAISGEEIYKAKLGDVKSFSASPVIADGKMYVPDEEGMVYVVQTGKNFKLLESIPLGDVCMSSPSITEDIIFFRSQKKLIAVSKVKE